MDLVMKYDEENERQSRLIHKLAVRLPWIVVAVTLVTAVATLLQIYLWGRG